MSKVEDFGGLVEQIYEICAGREFSNDLRSAAVLLVASAFTDLIGKEHKLRVKGTGTGLTVEVEYEGAKAKVKLFPDGKVKASALVNGEKIELECDSFDKYVLELSKC